MANIEGRADHAKPEDADAAVAVRTIGISPKALWGTVTALALTLGVPALEALVGYLTDNPDLLAALPWWVRVPLMAVVVAAGTALAAAKASPGVVVPDEGV